jgi:hypothetical protein
MTTVELAESAYVDSLSLDDGFGDWLAGFIDGEGCFVLARRSRGYIHIGFRISLRDDDAPILYAVSNRLGFGQLFHHANNRYSKAKPICGWHVGALDECWRLCLILDRFPLRARKRSDYDIWRRAVIKKREVPLRTRGRDWSCLHALCTELMENRTYRDRADRWS